MTSPVGTASSWQPWGDDNQERSSLPCALPIPTPAPIPSHQQEGGSSLCGDGSHAGRRQHTLFSEHLCDGHTCLFGAPQICHQPSSRPSPNRPACHETVRPAFRIKIWRLVGMMAGPLSLPGPRFDWYVRVSPRQASLSPE